MALITKTVTKVNVNQTMKGQYTVVWELKGFDESEIELFSQNFNEDYKTGDNPSRVEAGFIDQMQTYIDNYKSEQVILNHPLMDTAVTNVQASLEV